VAENRARSTGLSLGTTGVSIAVVQHQAPDPPELIAFDHVSCRYLRDGMIVNLEALEDAVLQCRKNIQALVKSNFHSVTVNLCGFKLRHEHGRVTHAFKKRREIRKKDLSRVQQGQHLVADDGWRLIHHYPESYGLDAQQRLTSPVGMIGRELSAEIQQVFAPSEAIENLLHALRKCRLRPLHLVADPLGSLEALITPDEREIGICLLDIGGSVIQMASVIGSCIRIPSPLFVGGDLVTSDIAIGLNTTIKDAERIKIEHGCAISALASEDRQIHIPPLGGGRADNPTSQQRLAEIIQSRMEEIFEMTARHIKELELPEHYTSGIILTGAGSLLPGTAELAETYLNMPVIEGHLRNLSGLTDIAPVPRAASAVGLALYGLRHPQTLQWQSSRFLNLNSFTRNVFSWLGGE